jgi:hypothetical protein
MTTWSLERSCSYKAQCARRPACTCSGMKCLHLCGKASGLRITLPRRSQRPGRALPRLRAGVQPANGVSRSNAVPALVLDGTGVLDVEALTGVIDARDTAKHRPAHNDLTASFRAFGMLRIEPSRNISEIFCRINDNLQDDGRPFVLKLSCAR